MRRIEAVVEKPAVDSPVENSSRQGLPATVRARRPRRRRSLRRLAWHDRQWLARACQLLEQQEDGDKIDADRIAAATGMSYETFRKPFVGLTGLPRWKTTASAASTRTRLRSAARPGSHRPQRRRRLRLLRRIPFLQALQTTRRPEPHRISPAIAVGSLGYRDDFLGALDAAGGLLGQDAFQHVDRADDLAQCRKFAGE